MRPGRRSKAPTDTPEDAAIDLPEASGPVTVRIVVRPWARVISAAKTGLGFLLTFAAIGLIVDGSEALSDGEQDLQAYAAIALGIVGIPLTLVVDCEKIIDEPRPQCRVETRRLRLRHHRPPAQRGCAQ